MDPVRVTGVLRLVEARAAPGGWGRARLLLVDHLRGRNTASGDAPYGTVSQVDPLAVSIAGLRLLAIGSLCQGVRSSRHRRCVATIRVVQRKRVAGQRARCWCRGPGQQ